MTEKLCCLGEKYLHVLVNNAGTMCHPRKKSEDGFEIHFQTNYLGNYVVILQILL
jgi:NAD(P)-dependent dehydrogenase (short-subunit alcohol dehydrogenase family)